MTNWEIFLLHWTGKIVATIGFFGLCLSIVFDRLARGLWQSYGWLQWSGIVTCLVIIILGLFVDMMLTDARKIIEDYLRS